MVNWVNKPLNRPWRFHALFIIVSRFSSHLDSVSFSHVPRNAHHMGDGFAKQGLQNSLRTEPEKFELEHSEMRRCPAKKG